MLYLALALVIAIGSVVLLFRASWRVRDQEARFGTDEVVARYLARGAVEILAYGVELELDRPVPPAPGGPSLRDVLALDARALAAYLERRTAGRLDHRELLELVLGPNPFRLIDAMVAEQPRARLTYRVELAVTGRPFQGLADPVEKTVEIGLQARCKLGHAEAAYRNDLTVAVYSELPWVLSRFAAVWLDARPDAVNALATSVQGERLGGPAPVVVFNAPEDFSADDPVFGGPARPEENFPSGLLAASTTELENKLAHRGATYIGTGAGHRPIALRIASGGPPLGQYFQMYPMGRGQTFYPQAAPLEQQPTALESFRPEPPGGGHRQRCRVHGAVLGYYSRIDSEELLGPPACGEDGSDATSLLRPLGTSAHPSAGLVYGDVRAGLAALADLAIDRDETAADEEAQRAAAGREPPERESSDPFFRNVERAEFEADLEREEAGGPYRRLSPFGTPGLGPGRVQNLNAALEPDPSLAVLKLDLGQYRYRTLFGTWPEYARVMSRRVCLPYNTLLRAAAGGAGRAVGLLLSAAFGASASALDGDLLTEARWVHSDPLHARLEPTAGHRNYVDTRAEGNPGLERLVRTAGGRPRYARAFIECKGEKLFRESFLTGNVLDLGGCEVAVVPEKKAAPPPRLDLGDLQVAPGGGGILRAPEVALHSLSSGAVGAGFSPLVVMARRLVLNGPGPFEGCFVIEDSLALPSEASPVVVKGFVYDARGTVLAGLPKPLAVVFDPRLDPTGPEANLHYRSHVLYGAGPRVYGLGGTLIDASDYRRPAARGGGQAP